MNPRPAEETTVCWSNVHDMEIDVEGGGSNLDWQIDLSHYFSFDLSKARTMVLLGRRRVPWIVNLSSVHLGITFRDDSLSTRTLAMRYSLHLTEICKGLLWFDPSRGSSSSVKQGVSMRFRAHYQR
ncbi:unnamed protein product [Sphenostylis stenocarpa]|uniref:Uncharacterized protein n=1 Tax=Sphenostylis stenocarpa TaxID=92480 RepID=A0AA86VF76_9FABA|nr:unnamed protein product [Sphenostylis stenocarpa]